MECGILYKPFEWIVCLLETLNNLNNDKCHFNAKQANFNSENRALGQQKYSKKRFHIFFIDLFFDYLHK